MKFLKFAITACSLSLINLLNATQGNFNTLIGGDSLGNSFTIWNNNTGSAQVVSVGKYSAGSWTNVALSDPTQYSFENYIGVIPTGEAIALWITADFVDGCNILYSSTYSSGVWSTPVAITPLTESVLTKTLQYVIDDTTQDVTITWQTIDLSTYATELRSSASNLATNTWTTPVTISTL